MKSLLKNKLSLVFVALIFIISFIYLKNYFYVKNEQFPFEKIETSSWNSFAKSKLEGGSEINLLQNLLSLEGSEGDFKGVIHQYRDENNNLVTIIRNNYVPDDSVGPYEDKFISKNQNGKYKVIEYSRRGSCRRDLSILSFFIDPLWTNHACS